MNTGDIKLLLERLRAGIGQKSVALRCDCDNLETVYITINESHDVCVTDDHKTFQYLDRGDDSTYIPLESFDLSKVQSICDSLSVDFKPAPADGFPSIEYLPDSGESIAEAVERVAEAVDQVFNLAMSPDIQ